MLLARHLPILLATLLCTSCMAPQRSEMVAVSPSGWHEAASVIVDNSDTLSLRKLSIVLRHNGDFAERELPLNVQILTPDGRIFEESHNFILHREHTASIISSVATMPYREDVLFAMKGAYIFVFEPHAEIEGVEAIGVEILDNDGKR